MYLLPNGVSELEATRLRLEKKDLRGKKGREVTSSVPRIMSAPLLPPPPHLHPRKEPGKEDQAKNRLHNSSANPPSFLWAFPED